MEENENKNKENESKLGKQLELELDQEYRKEKQRYKAGKQEGEGPILNVKKKFTKLQSIALLSLTLFFSTGGGYALGHFYFWDSIEMKRINDQLEYYQERVRINPSSLEDRIVLGYTHFLKGNNNQAVNEFQYVLEQDDQYYDAYYNLGLVYLKEEKYYDALSMFNKTVEIAPRDYKGYAQMGITYRNLKMYDDAINALSEANKLNPSSANIIYQLGLVIEAKGDYEGAAEVYKDALSFDPLFDDAIKALENLEQNKLKNGGEKNE